MERSQEQTHAQSKEEEDILRRAIKKAREEDHKEANPQVSVEMTSKELSTVAMSFKEKLMGGISDNSVEEQDD